MIKPHLHAARLFARLLLFCGLLALLAQPAAAQSVLRDAETEALLADMAQPLIEAAGMQPGNVEIILLNDSSINAFTAGGQRVFLHSGLITAAENANEVQGVIAHELGHVEAGHVIRSREGMGEASGISLLSLIAGAAAIAVGAPNAGMAILSAGTRAAMGRYLAFSRVEESSADLAGARYLHAAGISGRGSLAFFRRLQNLEYRLAIPQDNSYDRTHPLSGERIAVLRELYENDPAWGAPTDPALEARFQRVRAKLIGFVNEKNQVLTVYPESDQTIPAHYARAYAWHLAGYPDKAVEEADALLAAEPHDPYFLELKGQILLESGNPDEAVPVLREAVDRSRSEPLIAALFGHALIASENPEYLDEARQVLRTAVQRDNRNPFAWYQLGIVYAQEGDEPRAQLATAERYNLQGESRQALSHARQAMLGIPEGTSDWLRAQDIAMVSEAEVEEDGGRRGRN